MSSKTKAKAVKIIGVCIIFLQVIIDFMLSWIPTGEDFNIASLIKSWAFWVLIASIVVYIILYLFMEQRGTKGKRENNKLKAAFADRRIYDTVADTLGECIRDGDYKKFKKVRKMSKML